MDKAWGMRRKEGVLHRETSCQGLEGAQRTERNSRAKWKLCEEDGGGGHGRPG